MANTELTESIMTDKTGRKILKKLDEIVVSPQVVDNLMTDDPNRPLSARQGKYINDHVVYTTNNSVGAVLKSNADMLNGHPDTYFGTATDVQANADAISSLNSYIGGMLVVDVKTTPTVSVSGGSYESMNTDVTKSGYTALGIVGVSPTTINGVLTAWRFTDAVTVNTYVTNRTSSTISYSADLSILYVKNMS